MQKNNKSVYLVELNYDTRIEGVDMHGHVNLGLYEDIDDAINEGMLNCDDDLTAEDVKDSLEGEGEVDIWWNSMKIDRHFAKRVRATITEHVLITKKDS